MHRSLTILIKLFLALVVFAQAGCGGTSPTAQEQPPGVGPAVAALQASPSPTLIPATATVPPTPTAVVPTYTPGPTNTPVPSPTPAWQTYGGSLAAAKQETVTSASIDASTQTDILPKFSFSRFFLAKDCAKHAGGPTAPAFVSAEMLKKAKQMDAPLLISCGWVWKEPVKLTVRYPDGRENTKTFFAGGGQSSEDDTFSVSTFYQITLDDPAGAYTFLAESDRGRKEKKMNVEKTAYTLSPRVFPVYDDPFNANYHLLNQNRVLLYGFAPNEHVRLLLYSGETKADTFDYYYYYTFIGSQQVVTGPDGSLLIHNEIPNASYWVAIGETTGAVAESFYNDTGSLQPPTPLTAQCPVLLPTRLSDHTTIRVAKVDTQNKKIRVRKGPGFDKEIMREVLEGTEMWPQGNPQCAGGTWWWPVEGMGWVAEADPKEYILEPAQ